MAKNKDYLYGNGVPNPIPDLGLSMNGVTDAAGTIVLSEYNGQEPTVFLLGTEEDDIIAWEVNNDPDLLVSECVSVGSYDISVKITRAGYDPTTLSGILQITPRQLSVIGTTVDDKAFDGTNTANVRIGTLSGVINGDVVNATAIGHFQDSEAGEGKTVLVEYILTGDDAGNYRIESEEFHASIILTRDTRGTQRITWSGIKYKSRPVSSNR